MKGLTKGNFPNNGKKIVVECSPENGDIFGSLLLYFCNHDTMTKKKYSTIFLVRSRWPLFI